MSGMVYVGTSGFSYKEWSGRFYPESLPQKKYLQFYSKQFNTAEINHTFYRMPSEKTTEQWASLVPPHFRFALKLNRRITHSKRLTHCNEEMGRFFHGAHSLGPLLGCILVQLPPWFKKDLQVLGAFLKHFSPQAPLALEFRHESWFELDVYELLRNYGASLGVVDSDKLEAVQEVTAPFIYMRFRKPGYSLRDIETWAKWIRGQRCDVFVYFKHANESPTLARQLVKTLDQKAHDCSNVDST